MLGSNSGGLSRWRATLRGRTGAFRCNLREPWENKRGQQGVLRSRAGGGRGVWLEAAARAGEGEVLCAAAVTRAVGRGW